MYDMTKLSSVTIPFHNGAERFLPLFARRNDEGSPISPARSAVIYGPNGSGKSTFARVLRDQPEEVKFLDKDNRCLTQTGDIVAGTTNIHIYDEYYIEHNFRQDGTQGISPIVLLGKAVEEQDKEKALEVEVKKAKGRLQKAKKPLQDAKTAVKNIEKSIGKRLTEGNGLFLNGWQPRSSLYNPLRKKTSLGQTRLPGFIEEALKAKNKWEQKNEDHVETQISLREKFKEILKEFEEAEDFTPLSWQPPTLPAISFAALEDAVKEYLKAKSTSDSSNSKLADRIEKSALTPKALKALCDDLFSPPADSCPKCFQEISASYAAEVTRTIEKRLAAIEQNQHYARLASQKVEWQPNVVPHSTFREGEAVYEKIEAATAELTSLIESFNLAIDSLLLNPNIQVDFKQDEIEEKVSEIHNLCGEYWDLISKYNSKRKDITALRTSLEEINLKLAYREIADLLTKWSEASEILNTREIEWEKLENVADQAQKNLNAHLQKRKSSTAAAEKINQLLRMTLGSSSLQLTAKAEGYEVVNRACSVSPAYLSTGERNLLSLCYFITEISNEKEFSKAFSQNQLIILDDPISSFDRDNRYGIMSVLRWFSEQAFATGSQCRVCVFTHDLNVARDISAVFRDKSSSTNEYLMTYEDFQGVSFESKDYYRSYLQEMYNLSMAPELGPSVTQSYPIDPNHIRRVWEAFAAFELAESVVGATTSKKIQSFFESKGTQYASFFMRYPGRAFIHVDSHSQRQVSTGDPFLLPALIPFEYQRFSREILCFMQILSPHHIASRLADNETKATEILTSMEELVKRILKDPPNVEETQVP